MEVAARYKLLTLLFTVNTEGRFPEKTAVLLDFVQITPSPQFGQLVQIFSDVEIQDSQVSLGLKILYMLYNIIYIYTQPKEQLQVQIVGIYE